MQAALSYPGSRRWLVPSLLAIVVPLLFAALPGEPLQILAQDAGQLKHVRAQIMNLHEVRSGLQQAQRAEPETKARISAISGVRRALDAMTGESGPFGENVAYLRQVIEASAQTLTNGTDAPQYAAPAGQPLLAGVAVDSIDPVLGQLQANDEAGLQQPLLAMRLSAAALRSERDPQQADLVSRWAGIFAARLDDMAIPVGTRTRLKARLVAYEHAVLSTPEALSGQRIDRASPQAMRVVETALANAEHALTEEQQRLNNAFEVACDEFVWSFVAALAASLLIVGGGVFGRRVVDHGVVRARHAR